MVKLMALEDLRAKHGDLHGKLADIENTAEQESDGNFTPEQLEQYKSLTVELDEVEASIKSAEELDALRTKNANRCKQRSGRKAKPDGCSAGGRLGQVSVHHNFES